MKIKNELKHTVTVENELNQKVNFEIDPTDMVKMGQIAKLFDLFQRANEIKIEETDDFQLMMEGVEKVADAMLSVRKQLELTFGAEEVYTIFKDSNSMVMYNDFFEKLAVEIEKSGHKIQDYVKKIRKDRLVNDHKQSDTI